MDRFHTSVLLKEVIHYLSVEKGKKYIDATLGGGGHTLRILNLGGEVLGIDIDEDALNYVKEKFQNDRFKDQLRLVKGNFAEIEDISKENGFGKVSGIVFDLGVSSHQIDSAERGFSFLKEGPLDMRMDKDSPVNAEYLVNLLEKEKLYEIFKKLGQENRANAISGAIVRKRRMKAIKTTNELVDVIKEAYGFKGIISDFQKNKISQKIFQSLRIAVNNEIDNIRQALPQALNLLDSRGTLCVISFHSLEDRVVKNVFRDFENTGLGEIITKKPIYPTEAELSINPRAKSAKLRIFRRY